MNVVVILNDGTLLDGLEYLVSECWCGRPKEYHWVACCKPHEDEQTRQQHSAQCDNRYASALRLKS